MLTFFANGCCGNVNQINVSWAGNQNGPNAGERVGTMLAAAVFRALPELVPQRTFAPRVRSKLVTLQRRTFTEAEIAEARAMAPNIVSPSHSIPAKAKTVCILDTVANQNVPLQVEVQVVAVNHLQAQLRGQGLRHGGLAATGHAHDHDGLRTAGGHGWRWSGWSLELHEKVIARSVRREPQAMPTHSGTGVSKGWPAVPA
eukprot:gene35965-58989_t